MPGEALSQAWATLVDVAELQGDYPGVAARQARIYGGFGVVARWQCGRRERRVIGTAGDVRAALEKDFPSPGKAGGGAGDSTPQEAPAGEAVPDASPAGQEGEVKAMRKWPIVCPRCGQAVCDCPGPS